jgi:hypothetical protein
VDAAMTMLKEGLANEPVSRILKGRLIERATVKAG